MEAVVRTAFRLRWLPRHLLMIVAVAVLSLLGRWQWDVSESQRGGLQNLLYAFQWWVVAAMVIYGWWRLLHDDAHPRPREENLSATASVAGPAGAGTTGTGDDESWAWQPATARDPASANAAGAANAADAADRSIDGEADPELTEYNEYLTWLNNRAERTARQPR